MLRNSLNIRRRLSYQHDRLLRTVYAKKKLTVDKKSAAFSFFYRQHSSDRDGDASSENGITPRDLLKRLHQDVVTPVADQMNKHIVGHSHMKKALLLGLISSDHIYVEGPPGAAKTLIAETVASATDLDFFFYQLHRDTRLNELIGDSVVIREQDASGCGEIIRQKTLPGGILKSDICVLDDITRCPGEALNVLLRILNERKMGNDRLPLKTAIATGNPSLEDYYVEQLDPASLDRFTYQILTEGFISTGEWADALRVVDMYANEGSRGADETKANSISVAASRSYSTSETLALTNEVLLPEIRVGVRVKLLLLTFLKSLRERFALTAFNSLLTDRTFLVKSVRALRASAILDNRLHTKAEDLYVLELLTTFRVPPDVHQQVPKIIEDVIAGKIPTVNPVDIGFEEEDDDDKDDDGFPPSEGDDSGGGSDGNSGESDGGGDGTGDGDAQEDGNRSSRANEGGDEDGRDVVSSPEGSSSSSSTRDDARGAGDDNEDSTGARVAVSGNDAGGSGNSPVTSSSSDNLTNDGEESNDRGKEDPNDAVRGFGDIDDWDMVRQHRSKGADVRNMEEILNVLDGVFGGSSAMRESPGGSPRRWASCRSFADFDDCDAVESSMWMDSVTPSLPRRSWRATKGEGGQVALLRDTSRSMQGAWALWASALSSKFVEMSRKKRMQLAYLEFDHKIRCTSLPSEGDENESNEIRRRRSIESDRFFSNDYHRLGELVRRISCGGVTNFELPLAYTLGRFRSAAACSGRRPHSNRDDWMSSSPSPPDGPASVTSGKRKLKDFYSDFTHHTTWTTLDESGHDFRRASGGNPGRHIVFLTDGVPTSGDRVLTRELEEAKQEGIRIHTVFMGKANFPSILHKMSLKTGGCRFSAWKDTATQTIVVKRHRGSVTIPEDVCADVAVVGADHHMASQATAYEPSKTWMRWFDRQCS